MALEAGVIVLTLEFASGLKDVQWFGRQDPYCRVIIGHQEFKSRTATDGGKTPVWNETFRFNVINENSFSLVVKDDNIAHDDLIGHGGGTLARARATGSDVIQVPIMGRNHQHGFVQVTLRFERNSALQSAPPAAPYLPPPPQQQPLYAAPPPPQQYYAPPPPQPYPAPAVVYAAPPPVVYAPTPQVIYTPPPPSIVYVGSSHHHHHRHHGFSLW